MCESVAEADVAELLGADIISVEPQDPSGSSLGACEWIASNSTSLRVGVNDASDWEEFITMFGNEPAGDVEGLYYSDIIGLSWRPPESETYVSVWLPVHDDLESHVQALALVLGRQ